MSSLDAIKKEIVWTDENYIGLDNEWVKILKEKGYTLIDKRTKKLKIRTLARKLIIRLGIYTKEGKLHRNYGGEG